MKKQLKSIIMKKGLILATVLLLIGYSSSYGQFSFGVSPGIGLNSAYFGYKINNKLVPYVGFQYFNAKLKYEENGQRYDWDLDQVVSYSESSEFSGSLIIPNVGLKYFVKQQNKLQAYLSLNLSKPILTGKLKYDGEEDEEFKEAVKNISMWGGEFGFGVEYFFDENFSLGGEFGLRYVRLKSKQTSETEIYNPEIGDYQTVNIENNVKFSTSPTFSRISLNYYF